jgi:hypothetical protein
VRFLLFFELLLVRPLFSLELFPELRVGLLEVAEVVLEEPCLPSPFLLQLVEFSPEIDVLHQQAYGDHSRRLSASRISSVSA